MSNLSVIVLEGNELNFKSTVAEKLNRALGYEVIKGSSFEIGSLPYEEMLHFFREVALLENKIVDRFLYSNLVYATKYKGFTLIQEQDKTELEQVLSHKALFVYLYAPLETLEERFLKRGDEQVKIQELQEINHLYETVMEQAKDHVNVMMIDTTQYTSDEIATQILARFT